MKDKSIDWAEIQKHLEDTRSILEVNHKSDEEKTLLLRQRAADLAKEQHRYENQTGVEVIEFILGFEHYGIESAYVTRICEVRNITRLPATPSFVAGIINLHGVIVCVIDLKEYFQLPKSEANALNRILIVSSDGLSLGIMADAVNRIESIDLHKLQTSLPTITGVKSEFLLGITHDQKIILNAQQLIKHKDLVVNDSI